DAVDVVAPDDGEGRREHAIAQAGDGHLGLAAGLEERGDEADVEVLLGAGADGEPAPLDVDGALDLAGTLDGERGHGDATFAEAGLVGTCHEGDVTPRGRELEVVDDGTATCDAEPSLRGQERQAIVHEVRDDLRARDGTEG